jgi:molybdopterin-guanine dinucleotide biosynthesis protein A
MHPARPAFGAILAGGGSTRFGSPKALADVGGTSIVRRVHEALREAAGEVVLIANEAPPFADLGLRVRGDRVAGAGPLAGVHAALAWAREEGRPGALCIACDTPFVPAKLLARLLEIARETGADAVVPESGGRAGFEPLCAFYASSACDVLGDLLLTGERRASSLAARVRTERLPLSEVRAFGDPSTLFLNVNTPAEHELAQRIALSAEVER